MPSQLEKEWNEQPAKSIREYYRQRQNPAPEATRAEIKRAVAAFLRAGGQIKILPPQPDAPEYWPISTNTVFVDESERMRLIDDTRQLYPDPQR